jgi:hypothetical protein
VTAAGGGGGGEVVLALLATRFDALLGFADEAALSIEIDPPGTGRAVAVLKGDTGSVSTL